MHETGPNHPPQPELRKKSQESLRARTQGK